MIRPLMLEHSGKSIYQIFRFLVPQIDRTNFTIGLPQILFISGLTGFALGVYIEPTWHLMLEYSQVIAGVVHYDKIIPNYIYHKSLWAFGNQVFAFFLVLGFSERVLAFFASGLLGMLSFQSLSVITWSLSRSFFLSLIAPLFIYITKICLVEVCYPIILMGHPASHGIIGLSYTLLVIGLLGSKCLRVGGFLFGMAPCIHPSWAVALWVAAGISLFWDYKKLISDLKKAFPFFLIGLAVTIISLIVQQIMSHDFKSILSTDSSKYYLAFAQYWEVHRRPLNPLQNGIANWPLNPMQNGIVLLLFCFITNIFIVWKLKKEFNSETLFIFRLFIINAFIGILTIPYSWIPVDLIPHGLYVLMPARWMNMSILVLPALLLGIIGKYRDRLWAQCSLIMIALLFLSCVHGVAIAGKIPDKILNYFLLINVIIVICFSIERINKLKQSGILLKIVNGILIISVFLFVIDSVIRGIFLWTMYNPILNDRTSNSFFSTVARGNGMILTASDISFIQLRTRRPILLDGGDIDMALNYFSGTGPYVENILRRAYGIDLLDPPPKLKRNHRAGLLKWCGKELWESRTYQEWKDLANEWGVTSLLCYKDWKINIPKTASNDSFSLYNIQYFQ
jgi:hypothetical protein